MHFYLVVLKIVPPNACVENYENKGLCIKYIGGGRRFFVGVMINFKHILMGHEIFLKLFDGPRNIFLCSPLVILIFK